MSDIDLSEDPGACPGCGSLNACQGECLQQKKPVKKRRPKPIPPEHLGYCMVCQIQIWVDYPIPGAKFLCASCRPGGGVRDDGATF